GIDRLVFEGPINNPDVIESPVEIIAVVEPVETTVDAVFGFDFPGLVEVPLLTEDPLLEDPVASGGDSSLYSVTVGDGADEDDQATTQGEE
ncbi:MAG: hypothetical protein AAFZ11_07325, partial [Pseudomonadota bacterium]